MTTRVQTAAYAFALLTICGCNRCEDGCGNHSDDSTVVDDSTPHSDSGDRDNDGDGYGVSHGDCDDYDATVYPSAIEVCDGKDTNCDGANDETQDSLLFVSSTGVQTVMSPGTEAAPEQLSLTESGTLNVCGTVYASVTIDNIEISLLGLTDHATLSSSFMHTVVVMRNSSSVDISNLLIRDGIADICQFNRGTGDSTSSGGGVCCEDSTLELDATVLDNNEAEYGGGGIYADSCDMMILNSTLSNNVATEYGAGLLVLDGQASLNSTSVTKNISLAGGGGGACFRRKDDVHAGESFYISNSSFVENEASASGGGIFLSGPLGLECDGSADVTSGVIGNVAYGGGGGVWFNADGPILKSVLCDWGIGEQNNSSEYGGPDIGSEDMVPDAPDFENDETFDCEYYVCPTTTR